MQESPEDFFLNSKARFQNTQDEEDAAELYFAIRNMANHGLEVEWDGILEKAMEKVRGEVGAPVSDPGDVEVPTFVEPTAEEKRRERLFGSGPKRAPETRVRITPKLTRIKTRTRPGGKDSEGRPTPGEEFKITTLRMPGSREATQYNRSIVPSRKFDIQSLFHYVGSDGKTYQMTPRQIKNTYWVLYENTPAQLKEKERELIPDGGGITYGDYLRIMTGRPAPYERPALHERGPPPNPIQSLGIFSDSAPSDRIANSAHIFHSEFLDPDSHHFVKKIDNRTKRKNEEALDRSLKFREGSSTSNHLESARAINRDGDVVGEVLPSSDTYSRLVEGSYEKWLEKMSSHLSDELSEKDKRRLFRDWFDLRFDIGEENDNYIVSQLLNPDGTINERYSRSQLLMDPHFRDMREEAHDRVGLFPYLLGLQFGDSEARQYAMADYLGYMVKDHEHSIEDSARERHENRHENMGGLRIDELLDHMHTSSIRNWSAIAQNLMKSNNDSGKFLPPNFTSEANTRKSIISEALDKAHLIPIDPAALKDMPKGEMTGYDKMSLMGSLRAKVKSIKGHLKSAGVEWDDRNGVPADWDFDKDTFEEFDRYLTSIPTAYQKSAAKRFKQWLLEDPRGSIRGDSLSYMLNAAHEYFPVEPIVEGGEHLPHDDIEQHPRSLSYLWHSSLPTTGYNLYGPDISELLYCLAPWMGVGVKNEDIILFDSYNTKPPPIDTPEYYEWLKEFGSKDAPGKWNRDKDFRDRGGMSALMLEVDNYLRTGKMGKILEKVYNEMYANVDNLDLPPEALVSRVLILRAGELLREEENKNLTDSPEAGDSLEVAADDEKSSFYRGRTFAEEERPHGSRPLNERIARSILPILGEKDAISLFRQEEIGITPPPLALVQALDKKGQRVKDDTQDAIFNHGEMESRRNDMFRHLVNMATLFRGSSDGMVFDHHVSGSVVPSRTVRNTSLNHAHGGKIARLGLGDAMHDKVNMARGAGLARLPEGRSGVSTSKSEEDGMRSLLISALLGHGTEPAWNFELEDRNHLVVDKPMEWAREWMARHKDWLEDQPHPHIPGETMLGHLGLYSGDVNWRNQPEVSDGRYLYRVEKSTNDKGEDEYRIPLKEDEELGLKTLGLSKTPTPCPEKYEETAEWKTPFSILQQDDSLEQQRPLDDSKPWVVVPSKKPGEEGGTNHIIEEGGRYYFIGDHPAKLRDDFATLLALEPHKYDPRAVLELRRQAGEMAPKSDLGLESEKNSESAKRGYELLVRGISERHHRAKTVMPILLAQLASSHVPDDFDQYEEGDFTDEDRAEYRLKDFVSKYLKQRGGPREGDIDATKYATMCHLYDMAAKYADLSHSDDRSHLLSSLEKSGFKFNDKQKEDFLSETFNSDIQWDFGNWTLPKGLNSTHPFFEAYRGGKTRDIEGLELLRSYINKIYSKRPETVELLNKIVDGHFSLFGELNYAGVPVDSSPKELMASGKPKEHMDNIRSAQHFLNTQDSEDSDWEPIHYITPGDNKFSKQSREARNIERARRGSRAKMTLGLRDYLMESSRYPQGAIDLNHVLTGLEPVLKRLVSDLGRDDFAPEHRHHGSFDSENREHLLREYTRLLFLRAPINDKYEVKPHPTRHQRTSHVGDTIEREKDGSRPNDEDYFGIWTPNLNDVNGLHYYGDSKPLPFRVNMSDIKSPELLVNQEDKALDRGVGGAWDDPSRGYPTQSEWDEDKASNTGNVFHTSYRNYGVGILNSAFGANYASTQGNPHIQAEQAFADGDGVLTSLDVLTDIDLLLKEEDRDKGKPVPVKAMHRIFDLNDLEYLRGFSDDWVVTSWPAGIRVIVEKKGEKVKARNAEGKAVSIPNVVKRGVVDAHDKDFLVDGIWDEDILYIVDLLECEDDDLCNRPTKDRVRHLRAHFESTEKVLTPAPVNTKRVDGEGLERATKDLFNEPKVNQVLLRDAESTYMRGETRHPKWIMLTPDQHVDVLIISSSSDNSHLIGIGPLYDEDAKAIGNRGVKYDGEYYMDVGTISRSGLEEGMYVTVKTSGISHSMRKGYSVYRLNAPRYVKECEGGATDSVETLEILRNRQEGNVPHKLRIKKGSIHIEVPSGHVVYDTKPYGNAFMLKQVDAPDDYTLRVVESQIDYWSPLAAVLLRSEREGEKEDIEPEPPANHDKKPKKVIPKRDRLLKDPEVLKTVVVALEAVENMLKEKITWTGPKGLGIDYATPVESPRGPTEVTEPHNLPDHDSGHRQSKKGDCWCGAKKGDECMQGMGHNMEDCPRAHPPKEEELPDHLEVSHNSSADSSV